MKLPTLVGIFAIAFATTSEAQLLLPEAPWSPNEHQSLVSLVDGCRLISGAYREYSSPTRDISYVANRNTYSTALQDIVAAWRSCLEATQRFYGTRSGGPADGKSLVSETIRQLEAVELPVTAQPRFLDRAISSLERFDPTLSYARTRPTIYPRTVGSHGDHDWALARLADFQDEILPALDALAKLIHASETPKVNVEALTQLNRGMNHLANATDATLAAASLTAFVVDKQTALLISTDIAAARGIRDGNFFRGVIALEHITNGGGAPSMFSGRPRTNPRLPSLYSSTQATDRLNGNLLSSLAKMNGDDWLMRQMDGGPFYVYRKQVFEAWQNADNFVFGMMGFYHPSPVPAQPGLEILGPLVPEAPWTQSEHDSLVHVVEAYDLATRAVASGIAERNAAVERIALASYRIGNGMILLTQMRPSAGPQARRDAVAQAKSMFSTTLADLESAANASRGQTLLLVRRASDALNAFDEQLTYLNWQGADYPNVIGLHGDYGFAMRSQAHAARYQSHVLYDLARLSNPDLTRNLPPAELAEIAAIAELVGQSTRSTFRAIALEAFIITPDDWALIRQDTVAASGLRPPSFFRSILALEYSFSKPGETPVNLAGRLSTSVSFPNSMTDAMVRLLDLAPRLARLNGGAAWMAQRMNRGGAIIIGATNNAGILAETYQDAFDLWQGVDNYGWGVIGFFHGVPAPPNRPTTHN